MGLDTPPHLKSRKTNIRNIAKDIYLKQPQINWWHLCILQSCPTAGSGSVKKMGELCSARLFLGLFDSNSSYLTSFCLASKYDTVPSPINIKRWRIATEAKCTLCSKDVCITAYILGTFRVSLQQGRYTFRHDTALCKVSKKFILNKK